MLPVTIWFLLSPASASNVGVMIKVAAMGQEASGAGAGNAAKSLIISTLAGGLAAIVGWELLAVWPSLTMYALFAATASLWFAGRMFKGAGMAPDGGTWMYALLTMFVVLAPAVLDTQLGSAASTSFYDRLLMFIGASLYGVTAVYVFDAFWPLPQRHHAQEALRVIRWLPGLNTLRNYKLAWLPNDLAAGLVLTTMLVPVGIAYAVASGVPGIYGLYATIVPLLAYALLGPSRILVLGPDSSLAAVILAVVLPLSAGDPARAITVASLMAIVSGLVCIAAGVLRLGFITELLSKPIRYGYMNGIALVVVISQLPKLLGFSIESTGPLRDLGQIVSGCAGRPGQRRDLRNRRCRAGRDPAVETFPAPADDPDRGGGGDRRRRLAGPREHRRRQHTRATTAGPAGIRDSVDRHRRSQRDRDRRLCRRAGCFCRYQRVVTDLCGQNKN